MASRIQLSLYALGILFIPSSLLSPSPACCPASARGKPVVNADQTVIMLWDADAKTQHFIRQASFKSDADDFGFLVPSPTQPELSESGNEAFPYLMKVTEPEVKWMHRPAGGMGCGCSASKSGDSLGKSVNLAEPSRVTVLQEELVAGFQAAVLEATSANDLINWLKEHGYAYSPEIEAWAKPYVEAGWKITALKVAKSKEKAETKDVTASALEALF